ncbi:MAG: hypothetical protein IT260_02190 [Saprospiraceae bacterium]|nr:hypothetical protein [Saprospiraceae bacterium]
MENSRLLKLLRSFSPEELRGLKKFVQSPYFNQRREVVALFEWLEKPLKTERPVPDKEVAFRAVFGDLPFDDHRIRMAMSFLFQLSTQFLSIQDFQADAPAAKLRLAALLRQRKLHDQAEQQRIDSAAELLRRPLRNADFHQQHYQFLLEKYSAEVALRPNGPLPLQELSDQLDRAFLSRKLWQSCFMLSHQTVYNTRYEFGLLDAALEHLAGAKALEDPCVALYFHCYNALANPREETHFKAFKRLLLQHSHLFPDNERRDLYVLAINFCIRQYNTGNPEYLSEQFDFYREGLAKKYFLTDGVLSRYTYQNAATIGLVMHELEWVESFIHEYRAHLPEPHRESLFSFNMARLEYKRQHLDQALQLLQKAEYKDLMLSLAAKTLQLKIYFEMDAFDLLESHLQALQTFIRRKSALGYHRENYLNTIHFTRKLLETDLSDKAGRAALRAEIEATKAVATKEWLLEQVE